VTRHRYINLDVGYEQVTVPGGTVPGGGRKGGDKEHASYVDAKEVARRVEQILSAAGRRDDVLSRYKLMPVEPTNAHPKGGTAK
jgi:hypothetical protein